MRILTVRQPYAWAIVHGGKDVENRSSNIAGTYRGPVAIHVAKQDDDGPDIDDPMYGLVYALCPGRNGMDHNSWACERCSKIEVRRFRDYGTIIGVVDLVDVHYDQDCWHKPWKHEIESRCSAWAMADNYHMVLERPRALAVPIPFKGALGLRVLDAGTVAAIADQLAICPDCRDGKCHNCPNVALDPVSDEFKTCGCIREGHTEAAS